MSYRYDVKHPSITLPAVRRDKTEDRKQAVGDTCVKINAAELNRSEKGLAAVQTLGMDVELIPRSQKRDYKVNRVNRGLIWFLPMFS